MCQMSWKWSVDGRAVRMNGALGLCLSMIRAFTKSLTSFKKLCMGTKLRRESRKSYLLSAASTNPSSNSQRLSIKDSSWLVHFWMMTGLRWFETVFHFPFQLNFMKGLLVYSKRLLLLVDRRCCNNLSTYQLLYCHWHFGCHGNLTGPQIHPISSIQLHFTQNVVGELPFLLHQNCLHIKEHFLRKFKKIMSRGFGTTLIFCNIKVA